MRRSHVQRDDLGRRESRPLRDLLQVRRERYLVADRELDRPRGWCHARAGGTLEGFGEQPFERRAPLRRLALRPRIEVHRHGNERRDDVGDPAERVRADIEGNGASERVRVEVQLVGDRQQDRAVADR